MNYYQLIHKTQTDIAILFFENTEDFEEGKDPIWLPKSQIILDCDEFDLERGEEYSVQVPEWLAVKVGLE